MIYINIKLYIYYFFIYYLFIDEKYIKLTNYLFIENSY